MENVNEKFLLRNREVQFLIFNSGIGILGGYFVEKSGNKVFDFQTEDCYFGISVLIFLKVGKSI